MQASHKFITLYYLFWYDKIELSGSVLIGNSCIVGYVFVCFLHHFSQFWWNLCCEHVRVDRCFISLKNARAAELHVGDAVSASLNKCWNNHLCHHLFGQDRHHSREWLKSAHSIIETLLVHIVTVDDLGDEACNNPVSTECCRELSRFFYTHVTNWGRCICEVLEVDCFEASSENLKAECYWEFSNQFKNCHANAPLCVLGHCCQNCEQARGKKLCSDNSWKFMHVRCDIKAHFRAIIL